MIDWEKILMSVDVDFVTLGSGSFEVGFFQGIYKIYRNSIEISVDLAEPICGGCKSIVECDCDDLPNICEIKSFTKNKYLAILNNKQQLSCF